MSTLREFTAAKNAPNPPRVQCVETDYHPVGTVTFCPWQAKEWTVPWARFDAMSFSNEQELERVEIFFSHHQVIVIGENLRKITDDLRSFKVLCLRDLPVSHRAGLGSGAVFITQLEVRLLADPKNRPPTGDPP